jgi:hypothetical protein
MPLFAFVKEYSTQNILSVGPSQLAMKDIEEGDKLLSTQGGSDVKSHLVHQLYITTVPILFVIFAGVTGFLIRILVKQQPSMLHCIHQTSSYCELLRIKPE